MIEVEWLFKDEIVKGIVIGARQGRLLGKVCIVVYVDFSFGIRKFYVPVDEMDLVSEVKEEICVSSVTGNKLRFSKEDWEKFRKFILEEFIL